VHPAGPMLAPHLSREDTSVGGYDIPAGTVVPAGTVGHRPRPDDMGRARGVPAGAICGEQH
jgi:cytochrome P450